MKPIGLVTCYFHHNYGSVLQAYATEMIFKNMNIPYQTIACLPPKKYMQGNKFTYLIKKLLIGDWGMAIGKIKIKYYRKKYPETFGKNFNLRKTYFDDFIQTYFHLSQISKTRKELNKLAQNYCAILVGSDQLWRTDSVEHGYYTLEWVPDQIKKIAYSTSFGITKIPWFQIKKNRNFMNRFDFIALREKSGCEIVYNLTGKKVETVLDPTLLFTGEQWMHIQEKEAFIKEPYIFCYLLGNNKSHRELIQEFKKKTNLKIVALLHLDEYMQSDEDFADISPYNVGPGDFLNLIRNAQYIFTDSFHCSVFSILYKKEFYTFSRFSNNSKQNTNTRIDNLLSITGLQERRIYSNQNINDILNIKSNFSQTEKKLEILRQQSFDYIKTALNTPKHDSNNR